MPDATVPKSLTRQANIMLGVTIIILFICTATAGTLHWVAYAIGAAVAIVAFACVAVVSLLQAAWHGLLNALPRR